MNANKIDMINWLETYKNNDEYNYYGVRFDQKIREIGDIISEYSKHNPDRLNERDFPAFGTDEYNNLPELDGLSVYNLDDFIYFLKNEAFGNDLFFPNYEFCYVLGCDSTPDDGPDQYESLFVNSVVVDVYQK